MEASTSSSGETLLIRYPDALVIGRVPAVDSSCLSEPLIPAEDPPSSEAAETSTSDLPYRAIAAIKRHTAKSPDAFGMLSVITSNSTQAEIACDGGTIDAFRTGSGEAEAATPFFLQWTKTLDGKAAGPWIVLQPGWTFIHHDHLTDVFTSLQHEARQSSWDGALYALIPRAAIASGRGAEPLAAYVANQRAANASKQEAAALSAHLARERARLKKERLREQQFSRASPAPRVDKDPLVEEQAALWAAIKEQYAEGGGQDLVLTFKPDSEGKVKMQISSSSIKPVAASLPSQSETVRLVSPDGSTFTVPVHMIKTFSSVWAEQLIEGGFSAGEKPDIFTMETSTSLKNVVDLMMGRRFEITSAAAGADLTRVLQNYQLTQLLPALLIKLQDMAQGQQLEAKWIAFVTAYRTSHEPTLLTCIRAMDNFPGPHLWTHAQMEQTGLELYASLLRAWMQAGSWIGVAEVLRYERQATADSKTEPARLERSPEDASMTPSTVANDFASLSLQDWSDDEDWDLGLSASEARP